MPARVGGSDSANGLDVVAIRIEHEGGIVGRAVVLPYAGSAIVPSACRKRCAMKRVHGVTCGDFERYMERTRGRFARVNVEQGAPVVSEAYRLFTLVNQRESQRCECLLVEVPAPRKILHAKTDMGDLHDGDS